MKFYVGVTDNAWYSFLAERRPEELNFWRPSGMTFGSLTPGEPFLFKPHYRRQYPYDRHCVAGGGFFAGFEQMTVAEAWDTFGEGNGAPDFATLCRLLKEPPGTPEESVRARVIGSIVLVEPFFFEPADWVTIPDWSSNIVSGKGYDTSNPNGESLWRGVQKQLDRVERRAAVSVVRENPLPYLATLPQSRYGGEFLTRARLGQGAFRMIIANVYEYRCAISGETAHPVLEAAHIKPFALEGPHTIQNGLLLRSDLHRLFDRGLITITPEYIILVSDKLRKSYGKSPSYSQLHNTKLTVLPRSQSDYPGADFLEWHNRNVFLPK